ncbi:hypothetical protein Tco_1145537 [Tanacetum coccineum]
MEAGINNMTLNEYLMYLRNRNLARSYPSRKSVAPMRNIIYPDSEEEDEDYYSLPHLLPCFQTPQPCATLKHVHHNNHSEVDIKRKDNKTKMSKISQNRQETEKTRNGEDKKKSEDGKPNQSKAGLARYRRRKNED